MKVKFKKLSPNAQIPKFAKPDDAGLDLTATSAVVETEQIIYGTGLAVEIPAGHVGLLFPRSSVCKTSMSLSNCVGVIDAGYRGEIKAVFNRFVGGGSNGEYKPGDRIVQMIILPYPAVEVEEVNELSDSVRGSSGFGSSGA